jgi:hypothetical protein
MYARNETKCVAWIARGCIAAELREQLSELCCKPFSCFSDLHPRHLAAVLRVSVRSRRHIGIRGNPPPTECRHLQVAVQVDDPPRQVLPLSTPRLERLVGMKLLGDVHRLDLHDRFDLANVRTDRRTVKITAAETDSSSADGSGTTLT